VPDRKPTSGAPKAETIVRRTAEFYKQAKSLSVEVERVQKMGGQTVQMTSSVAFQRR